jgi:hypothetical protein
MGVLTLAAMLPIEHPYPDEPMGLPSPEALQLATDVIRRHYVLPETMEHPQVRSECMRLAYMIMACGLAPPEPRATSYRRSAQDRCQTSRVAGGSAICRHLHVAARSTLPSLTDP